MSRVLELLCHPDTPCGAEIGISVAVRREPSAVLRLGYRIAGNVDALAIPVPVADSGRAHELWRATCLEAFVAGDQGEAYREYNLAPSRQWAAYDFTGYREGMADAAGAPPEIAVERGEHHLDLVARLSLPSDGPLRIGLSAVIEERDGRISYWALAHPPGKPDFHHPACFAFELPAPEAFQTEVGTGFASENPSEK